MVTLAACSARRSQLDGVRRSELKIESRIATGVSRLEYPAILSELAFELLLAKDLALDAADSAAAQKYAEVLETYMAAKDVWEKNQKFRDCLNEFHGDSKFCKTLYGDAIDKAGAAVQIQPDVAEGPDAVQAVWQMAKQKSDAAERIRYGQPPPLPDKKQ